MSYNLNPNNRAGYFGAMYPSPYDRYGNERVLFRLDGFTPASIQERLEEVANDSLRRNEAQRFHQHDMAQQRMQRPNSRYFVSQQNRCPENSSPFAMSQPYRTAHEAFADPSMHKSYMARPPVPVRGATRYMHIPEQLMSPGIATTPQFVNPPYPHEQTHIGNKMWNPHDPAGMRQHQAQQQQQPRQMTPPPNHFSRLVTISESYSTRSVKAPNNAMHHHNSSQMHVPREPRQHNTMVSGQQESEIHHDHIPQTVTEMNEELKMQNQAVPYSDQFQMPPSKKLLRRQGSLGPEDSVSQTSSGGYKGNPAVGIRNLANHLNCALWLTNLHPNIQPHEVFEKINTGSVSGFEITRPQGVYVMSAAKLVFKHPEAAARFIRQCERGGIWIRKRKVKARYNYYGHLRYNNTEKTRMLSVEGPAKYVDYEDLKLYFESFCDHELSDWETRPSSVPGHRKLVWGFARINGQATQCLEGLKVHPVYGKFLTVKYAPDPCGRYHL